MLISMGLVWILIGLLAGCATALPRHDQPSSHLLYASHNSHLKQYVQSQLPDDASLSGFTLLHHGKDALAARLYLIDTAEYSLDLQYYIYQSDLTGALLAERLVAAADRGVRVRMLIDDIGSGLKDFQVATLDLHPNIEVRLFNPLTLRQRWLRYLSKVGEFGRINYRMHNKLMLADSEVLITGGRNIGNEYFALSEMDFQDIDIVGIGPVSKDAARDFDEYWNSRNAIPVQKLTRRPAKQALMHLREGLGRLREREQNRTYMRAIADAPFTNELRQGQLAWHWGLAEWLSDPASKAEPNDELSGSPYLGRRLGKHALESREELMIMSAYLIPGDRGQAFMFDLVEHGVDVKVLTNSLASTDVLAVHSAYAKYRKSMLESGVQLWELRPIAAQQERANTFLSDSLASLHAKTFIFDRQKVFVGSINMDPRSINLNTESGVLVHQPELAREMVELFERWTSEDFAFQLSLDPRGALQWQAEGQTWTAEPDVSRFRRISTWLLGWLPIEEQL